MRLSANLECLGMIIKDPVLELKDAVAGLKNGSIARIETPVNLSSDDASECVVLKDADGNVYYLKHYRLNELMPADGNVSLLGGVTKYKLVNIGNPENPSDAATKEYVDNLITGWIWQKAVLEVVSELPTSGQMLGDRYLVIGSTEAYENSIMEWDGGAWDEQKPSNNWAVEDRSNNNKYVFSSTLNDEWIEFSGLSYTAGDGIEINGVVIGIKRADGTDPTFPFGSGIQVDSKGAMLVGAIGVLKIQGNNLFLNHSHEQFVNIGDKLYLNQVVVAADGSVINVVYKQDGANKHLMEVDLDYNYTLENANGLGVKVHNNSTISKTLDGLDIKLLANGGINKTLAGELYIDDEEAKFSFTFKVQIEDLGTLKAISLSAYNNAGGDARGAIVMFKEILGNNEIPALVDYEYDKTSVPAHIYMRIPDNEIMVGRSYKVIIK
jgi:hypothetical protein